MANYQEASVKLTNSTEQIKSCRKKQKNKKHWDEELPHKLFLTANNSK